jgi:hypothetical protein
LELGQTLGQSCHGLLVIFDADGHDDCLLITGCAEGACCYVDSVDRQLKGSSCTILGTASYKGKTMSV